MGSQNTYWSVYWASKDSISPKFQGESRPQANRNLKQFTGIRQCLITRSYPPRLTWSTTADPLNYTYIKQTASWKLQDWCQNDSYSQRPSIEIGLPTILAWHFYIITSTWHVRKIQVLVEISNRLMLLTAFSITVEKGEDHLGYRKWVMRSTIDATEISLVLAYGRVRVLSTESDGVLMRTYAMHMTPNASHAADMGKCSIPKE